MVLVPAVIATLMVLLLFLRVGFRLRCDGVRMLLSIQLGGWTIYRIELDRLARLTLKKIQPEPAEPPEQTPSREDEQGRTARQLIQALGGLSELIDMLRDGMTTAIERLLKKIVFHRLMLDLAVGAPDPMQTTLLYGALSATVSPAMAWITQTFTVHRYRLLIEPNYALQSPSATLDLQVWMRVYRVPHTVVGLMPLLRRVRAALRPNLVDTVQEVREAAP